MPPPGLFLLRLLTVSQFIQLLTVIFIMFLQSKRSKYEAVKLEMRIRFRLLKRNYTLVSGRSNYSNFDSPKLDILL